MKKWEDCSHRCPLGYFTRGSFNSKTAFTPLLTIDERLRSNTDDIDLCYPPVMRLNNKIETINPTITFSVLENVFCKIISSHQLMVLTKL